MRIRISGAGIVRANLGVLVAPVWPNADDRGAGTRDTPGRVHHRFWGGGFDVAETFVSASQLTSWMVCHSETIRISSAGYRDPHAINFGLPGESKTIFTLRRN